MAALRLAAEKQLSADKILDFKPYPKQRQFFDAGLTARERLLRAGNQNGKTYAVGAETTYHLTGEYPDWWTGRRFVRPVVCWASGETGEMVRDNAQRVLLGQVGERGTGLIPERCLRGTDVGMASGITDLYDYIKVRHVSGGQSLLRFKFYAQGRKRWQGPPIDVVWFDEEPPEEIYDEGLARTISTGGMVMLSFTPLLGMSNVVMRYLGEAHTADRSDTNMTIDDALHIPVAERQKIIDSFPEWEREARARGTPSLGSGRIFPVAEDSISVEPFAIPNLWPVIGGIDFGWDHPTAAVKLAWDRDTDCIYVTACYRQRQTTSVLHAAALKPWGEFLPWAWPHDGLQHDKDAGLQLAEQYRTHGLNLLPMHAQFDRLPADTKVSRTSVEAGLMDMLIRMQTGRFKVFSCLRDWWEEFRLYHRKDGKVVKLLDDLMSATRYAIMMLPYAVPGGGGKERFVMPPPRNWRVA